MGLVRAAPRDDSPGRSDPAATHEEPMMRTAKSVGRTIGVLYLLQMAVAPLVNFGLLAPALTAPPGFLANAAANTMQVNVAVLLSLVTGALALGIAITAAPVFRGYSDAMALWFVALRRC